MALNIQYDPPAPWSSPPAGGPQIGLVRLRDHVLHRWGGVDAGIYADRPIRGSSSPSVHRDGRAWDWQEIDDDDMYEAAGWVVAHAEALQIQRVILYKTATTWTPRDGWHPFTGTYAGQLPNRHVERNWQGALDARTIEEILGEEDADMARTDEQLKLIVQAAMLDTLKSDKARQVIRVEARHAIDEEYAQATSSANSVLTLLRRVARKLGVG